MNYYYITLIGNITHKNAKLEKISKKDFWYLDSFYISLTLWLVVDNKMLIIDSVIKKAKTERPKITNKQHPYIDIN